MGKFILSREIFLAGKKLMDIPFSSSIYLFVLSVVITLLTNITSLFLDFPSIDFTKLPSLEIILIFFSNIFIYAIVIIIEIFLITFIISCIFYFGGWLLTKIGRPDRISWKRPDHINHKFVEIQVKNDEKKYTFIGECKILSINNIELPTPLTMGVVHGNHVDPKIIIPPGEPLGIGIGRFDEKTNLAYFTDLYHEKERQVLPHQAMLYVKLSGKLEGHKEPIIKKRFWAINYQDYDDGKGISLSYAQQIPNIEIGAGKLGMKLMSSWITMFKKK